MPRRGAILIMIIGLVFLLSLIVTEVISLVYDEIRRKNDFSGNETLKIHAYNAFELTLATLKAYKEVDKDLYSPSQGWGTPNIETILDPEDPNLKINISIIDETGKISLRTPSRELISTLFLELEISESTANALTDALIDWIDEDNKAGIEGAESEYYLDQDPPYVSGNQPLISYKQLFFVKGFSEVFLDEEKKPNELFYKFKNATSLYSPNSININNLDPLLISTVCRASGLGKKDLEEALYKFGHEEETDKKIIRSLDLFTKQINKKFLDIIQVTCGLLKIHIQVSQGERVYSLTALLQPPKKSKKDQKALDTGQGKTDKKSEEKEGDNQKKDKEQLDNTEFQLLLILENAPLE